MRGQTKKVAICGVLAALSIAVLVLGTVIEVLDMTAAAVASLAVFLAVNLYGLPCGIAVYAVIIILSMIFFPGRFTPIAFFLIGIYPLIKNFFDSRIKKKALKVFLKLLVFNIFFTVFVFLGKSFLFTLNVDGNIALLEKIFIYPIGNLFVILFDILLTRIIILYGALITKIFK